MEWRIDYLYRPSIMGSPIVPMRLWMLPLEEHSYHLQSIKPQLLWRKWRPTKVGMKKELKPIREVEVCTS
jgi:hypothetical protein